MPKKAVLAAFILAATTVGLWADVAPENTPAAATSATASEKAAITLPANPAPSEASATASSAAATLTNNADTETAATLPTAPARRVVEAIVIHFKGVAPVAEGLVRSHIELKEGGDFSQAALDRSIKALFATGFFNNVYATPEERSQGKMTVTFEIAPKLKIRTIVFEGNRHQKAKKLEKECGLKPNEMLGAENLAEAVRKLKAFYLKKNYPDVKIVTRTTPLENAGVADVTFVVDEGAKQKVTAIRFSGNAHVRAKDLTKAMVTKKDSWVSWLTGSGKIDEDQTTDDLRRIGEVYRNRGYLEVKVTGPAITPHSGGSMLTYTIVEGPQFIVGGQSVEGATLFTKEQLAKQFALKQGRPLSAEGMEATVRKIRELYGSGGYLETAVRSEMAPTGKPTVLDVKYTVKESKRYTVGTINISGNTTTKNLVVARELLLAPGDTFSTTKMQTSEERLRNTSYFEQVNLTHEPNAMSENSQDLSVSVKEGKTGNVSFGAGFGSLDKATVFAEFTQGNFDIANWRNFFRGGGQKLRLYLSLSELSNQAILNFEEPWLFQHRIAGGFSLYRTETDYLSTEYNERRMGTEWYLRKRLVELIDARLGYRIEDVTIFGVDSAAAQVVQDEAGSRTVSKMTLELTRDTRDKITFPTKGNRVELNTAWAGHGLGGDTDYWLVETRGAQYVPSFEWPMPQYLSLLARAGTMDGFGSSRVPLFDKFFMGGPNTLRGFAYRKVGPKDAATGEPLGGKTYGFASAEYAFQVAQPLQLAAFYDVGFLNTATGDFSTARYNDDWGVGFRLLIMGAPLRVDYAMPITADSQNNNSGRFWFSFGTRF